MDGKAEMNECIAEENAAHPYRSETSFSKPDGQGFSEGDLNLGKDEVSAAWKVTPPHKNTLDSLDEGSTLGDDDSPAHNVMVMPPSGVTTPGTPKTPCTEGSSLTPSPGKQDKGRPTVVRKSQTIAEFRENQMRCMDTLRKSVRASAVAAALRQTSEPSMQKFSPITGLGGLGKQVSEESIYSDRFSDKPSEEPPAAADPMLAVVKSLSIRQYQCYERLVDDVGRLRQEVAVQHQELKEHLRKHGRELEEMKAARQSRGLSLVRIFATAFGASLGLAASTQLCSRGSYCSKKAAEYLEVAKRSFKPHPVFVSMPRLTPAAQRGAQASVRPVRLTRLRRTTGPRRRHT